MTWCAGAEFDLVVSDELDHLDSDAVPGARAATDHTSGADLERRTIYAANLGIRERPSIKPHPHHLCQAARIIAVGLVDLRLQHRPHVPRLNADHRQARFGENAVKPLR